MILNVQELYISLYYNNNDTVILTIITLLNECIRFRYGLYCFCLCLLLIFFLLINGFRKKNRLNALKMNNLLLYLHVWYCVKNNIILRQKRCTGDDGKLSKRERALTDILLL